MDTKLTPGFALYFQFIFTHQNQLYREITLQPRSQTLYFSAFLNSAHISTVTTATIMSRTGSPDLHDLQGVSLA